MAEVVMLATLVVVVLLEVVREPKANPLPLVNPSSRCYRPRVTTLGATCVPRAAADRPTSAVAAAASNSGPVVALAVMVAAVVAVAAVAAVAAVVAMVAVIECRWRTTPC